MPVAEEEKLITSRICLPSSSSMWVSNLADEAFQQSVEGLLSWVIILSDHPYRGLC